MDCEAACKLDWTSVVLTSKKDQHPPQSISPIWPTAKRFKSQHWSDDQQLNQSTMAKIGSDAQSQADPSENAEREKFDHVDQLTGVHFRRKDEMPSKVHTRTNQSCVAIVENNSIDSNNGHEYSHELSSMTTFTHNEHLLQNIGNLNMFISRDKQSTNLLKTETQSNESTPETVTTANQSNVINRLSELSELLTDSSNNHLLLDTITACAQSSAELEQLEVDKQKLYDHPLFPMLGKIWFLFFIGI